MSTQRACWNVTQASGLPINMNRQDACVAGLFIALDVYHDLAPRSAAMNMAIDEALLEHATQPAIRFYRWDHPALSFGYFGRYADVDNFAADHDLVRRWTGGGTVFHGDDLTYSLIIPASSQFFAASSKSIYAAIHCILRDALRISGEWAELAPAESPKVSDACFANAALADVIVDGRKVAGAAQRRTRQGLLHQGSIQHVDVSNGLGQRFAAGLSPDCEERPLPAPVIARAQEVSQLKYATQPWLRRR